MDLQAHVRACTSQEVLYQHTFNTPKYGDIPILPQNRVISHIILGVDTPRAHVQSGMCWYMLGTPHVLLTTCIYAVCGRVHHLCGFVSWASTPQNHPAQRGVHTRAWCAQGSVGLHSQDARILGVCRYSLPFQHMDQECGSACGGVLRVCCAPPEHSRERERAHPPPTTQDLLQYPLIIARIWAQRARIGYFGTTIRRLRARARL